MGKKNFILDMIMTYFALVTFITIAILILGMQLTPEASFGYEAFMAPLIYGACGMLPVSIMYSARELTVKEFVIRKVLQFIVIEVMILFMVFYKGEPITNQKTAMVLVGISVFIIYAVSNILLWIQSCISAKQMTKQLMMLRQRRDM